MSQGKELLCIRYLKKKKVEIMKGEKKKKWQEILAATAFAEEMQNVHESIYFFML